MKQLTFAGHPVHPMVIAAPLGLLPFSAVMDVMHLATGKKSYADAAYYGLVGGYVGAAAAAATGIADYLTISPGGPMKRHANTHGILNAALMGLQTVNLAARRNRRGGVLPTVLNLIGLGGLLVSQWYGAELVYKHGMRVKAAEEKPQPQLRPPGDQAMVHAFNRVAEMMPEGGPGSEE